jgi:hypothetical protein
MSSTTTTTPVTAPDTVTDVAVKRRPPYGLMAEFDSSAAIVKAAEKVRDAGYRWWDCHTPFPVHGLDQAMGIRPTILPWFVLGGGLTGALLGLILQLFTNATGFNFWFLVPIRGYEFLISGKPFASIPAFIPVTFELTILLSASAAAFGMLILNGLPRWYHPVLKSARFARCTDDRFFLVIEARDPKYSRRQTEQFMRELDPLSIEELES